MTKKCILKINILSENNLKIFEKKMKDIYYQKGNIKDLYLIRKYFEKIQK